MGGTYDPPVRGLGFQPFQGEEEVRHPSLNYKLRAGIVILD